MGGPRKSQWLSAVIVFGVVYSLVGVAFPNPPASNEHQFYWRLAAWLICAVALGIHIVIERLWFRSSPPSTALHASAAVALGAFALAVAANIHALRMGSGNRTLLGLALVVWPVIAGAPAFVVAWAAAVGLARMRRSVEG